MRKAMILLVISFIFAPVSAEGFSGQVIQQGATGEDVIELQARLKNVGYYNGNVDGVFGWGTYWAVRNFQYEFGMEVDGLVGPEMKERLVNVSTYDKGKYKNEGKSPGYSMSTPSGYSENDIRLMANAVYGEARGEPYEGQVAVASVILNRIESAAFPNSVSGVIFEPRAFTAVSDGQIWLTPDGRAKEAVLDALNGWDPTGEAIYYFNPNTATSDWIWSRPQIKRIGKHIFCY